MSKVHLIADESLGGIEREYIEVERTADVGDYVYITRINHDNMAEIRKVTGVYADYQQLEFSPDIKNEDTVDWACGDQYKTLGPTDLIYHEGKRYKLTERKAAVGEKVIVLNSADADSKNIGEIYTVTQSVVGDDLIEVNGTYDDESTLNLFGDEYRVLEPVESEALLELTANDIRWQPDKVIDLLANLTRRTSALERALERRDQQIDTLFGNVQRQGEEIAELKHLTESNEEDIRELDDRTQVINAIQTYYGGAR